MSKTISITRKNKDELRELHILGRCSKLTCGALKDGCRRHIKEVYPDSKQPLSEHPKEAINWYEGNGYRAPFWLLTKVGAENRYANL